MSPKALEIHAFLTPSTCFTIACLAFSLVAISTIWTNSSSDKSDNPKRRHQRVESRTNAAHAKARPSDVQQKQSQLAALIALGAQIVQRLHEVQREGDLLSELTLLTASLCQLQQGLYEDATVLNPPHLATCFDTTMVSHQAVLSSLETGLASGEDSSWILERTTQQIRNQKPILDILLTSVRPLEVVPDGRGLSSPQVEKRIESDIDVTSAVKSDDSPDVTGRCWSEPPPEYSPPAADSKMLLAEKPKTEVETPKVDIAAPETGYLMAGSDALYRAVTENDSKRLEELLSNGADCSARFGDLQRTPLHQAAHLNHHTCLYLLLRHGAVASTEDAKGDTALHLAAWAGNVEALTVLLDFGEDVDWISGRDGYSPLWCAVSAYQIDAARLLLKHGARVNLRSLSGDLTPLHQAAVTGQGAMCELLLDRGAQPNSIDDEKSTPLHYAAAAGSVASVRALLRGGADVEARQVNGLSPVHWAAHKGHEDVLVMLLDHGARIDSKTEGSATPLHLAANRGHITVARVLIDHGASCRAAAASWDGIVGTPAEMAKIRGHAQLARMLKT